MIFFFIGVALALAWADEPSPAFDKAEALKGFTKSTIDCARPPESARGSLAVSGAAIAGKIISVTEGPSGQTLLRIQAYKTWGKGTPDKLQSEIEVKQLSNSSPGPDYFWKAGKEYLIYARVEAPGKYIRGLCPSRALELKEARADIKALGKPNWVAPASNTKTPAVAPVPSPTSEE